MIELEVRALMEKCLDAGGGDMAVGLCKGVEAGWVDTMLTPWKYNKGKVMVMRDAENAVRYLDPGDIPLPDEVREYHRQKLAEREKKEGPQARLRHAGSRPAVRLGHQEEVSPSATGCR